MPYRTSYYAPTWGFCLSHRLREQLTAGRYDVVIDATLSPGYLEWGELLIPGRSDEEVLLTTHVCHPSLANDNLSGIAALVELGRHLLDSDRRRYTYRLLFLPGTIGSISYLAQATSLERIVHGLVITGLGDPSGFTYKRSRRGDADIDRIAAELLAGSRLRVDRLLALRVRRAAVLFAGIRPAGGPAPPRRPRRVPRVPHLR